MKKLLIILCCLAVAFGCIKNKKNSEIGEGAAQKTYLIGIAKIITHPALDSIEQGIKDELAANGYTNVRYDVQSANGELATAASIANLFRGEKVDVAIGIATPTALAIANQIKDRPVVFSAVTDPIGAGLRTTLEPESGNVTGVSDMAPVREQIKLITELKEVKRIGHIYTPGEANSISMMKLAQQVCDELGIELILSTVNNTSEVKQATEIVAPKVDAIYVSNDNTVVAALTSLTSTATKYGVPVISADPSSAPTSGVTVAYGIDNYQTGRATGKIVVEILEGRLPSEIPVKAMNQPGELASFVDAGFVEKFGLTLPPYLK